MSKNRERFNDVDFFVEEITKHGLIPSPAGVAYQRMSPISKLHQDTYDHLKKIAKFKSVIDLGAGLGMFLDACLLDGKDAIGIDGSEVHFGFWAGRCIYFHPDWLGRYLVKKFDKNTTLPQADLTVSIEVFEHLDYETINQLASQLKSRYFLFSSTPNKDPEYDDVWGHINVHPAEWWDAMFGRYGYKRSEFSMNNLPTPWAVLYEKNN